MGWLCLVVVGVAVIVLVTGVGQQTQTRRGFDGEVIVAGLLGACMGTVAVVRARERSWLVWLAGPGVLGMFLLGWILILSGEVSFAGH